MVFRITKRPITVKFVISKKTAHVKITITITERRQNIQVRGECGMTKKASYLDSHAPFETMDDVLADMVLGALPGTGADVLVAANENVFAYPLMLRLAVSASFERFSC